ncbi:MAG: hypothetical protein LBC85_06455 [Fibromonadaceae bacterium]|jgi:GTPase SAR1 family protein|nr:hypothetical protein [Fibromonadaceae bacterium]
MSKKKKNVKNVNRQELSEEKTVIKQVKEKIKDLNREQTVFFLWLCSLRILPFIGAAGNFNFWKKNEIHQHLNAIINAIDIVAIYNDSNDNAYVASTRDAARNAARAHAQADNAARDAINDANDIVAKLTKASAASCATIAYAVTVAHYVAKYDTIFYYDTISTAIDTATTADFLTASKYPLKLYNIILEDISYIKENTYDKFNNDISLYGDVWNNFQKALSNIGCGYWSVLYKNILQNRFQIDKKALKLRLNIPQEIKDLGAKAVADYLEQMELSGSENLNEARIIILGEKGAGKTSLARRLVDPKAKMPEERESTEGVDITSFKLKDAYCNISEKDNTNVHIWDFAGHSITHAAHRCFLSERCIYIILYDGRTEGRNRLDYWLNHVRDYGGDSKIYVLANIKDDHKPNIEENYIRKHYTKHLCEFYYFSIKDDVGKLENFRFEITQHIVNDPAWGQNIPNNYFLAKEKLKSTFSDERDYITIDDFKQVVPEVSNEMLKALHSLGICLHYEEIDEFCTLVLSPKWITWGIYHIINWLKNIQEHYQLKISDFNKIFADSIVKYPMDKHHFLYRLLIKYELAYEDNNKGVLIIPQCLNKDQPEETYFPEFLKHERLFTRFDAKQKDDNTPMPFPPDIMPRIIVKRSTEASFEKSKVWRYGALLYFSPDTFAYIQQKDSVILLKVAGKERQHYHDMIRGTILDTIYSYTSFQENDPEIKYELIEHPDTMYPETSLKNLLAQKLPTFDDLGLNKTIDVQENARQYKIDNLTIIHAPIHGGSVTFDIDTTVSSYNHYSTVLKNRLDELTQLLESSREVDIKELTAASKCLSECKSREQSNKMKKLRTALGKVRDQLADEESTLHKTVKTIKNGTKLAQDFIEVYKSFSILNGW